MTRPLREDEGKLRVCILAYSGRCYLDKSIRPPRAAVWVYDLIEMNEKRAHGILEKWSRKGWWEWGVSLRTGWLTEEGWEALRAWDQVRRNEHAEQLRRLEKAEDA